MEDNNISKEALNKICIEYLKRSNTKGFVAIFSNWGKVIFIAWLVQFLDLTLSLWGFVIYFIFALYTATVYRGFENLTHEASHYNLFANKKWNNSLQWLFAFPVFKNVYDYRYIHMQHHIHLGDPNKDPDLIMYANWGLNRLNSSNFIWLFLVRPIFFIPYYYLKNSFFVFWFSRSYLYSKSFFWVLTLISIGLLDGWKGFVLVFVIPFFIVLPSIRFWCEASEHIGFDLTKYIPNSRNNIGLMHSVVYPFNDGYHQIHHIAPYVPWYLLPKLHKKLMTFSIYKDNVQNSFSIIRSFKIMIKSSTVTK